MSGDVRPCGRCHRPVIWAWTVNGKPIPLDPDVNPDGNQATRRDHTGRVLTRQLGDDYAPEPYERLRMPHVATCGAVTPRPLAQPDGTLSLAAARDRRRRGMTVRGRP